MIFNTTRMMILAINTFILVKITNPSIIYHWVRGQSVFKLYMIKAVGEIVGLLFQGYGQGILENFTRAMCRSSEAEVSNDSESIF
jgi:hypothetical protein